MTQRTPGPGRDGEHLALSLSEPRCTLRRRTRAAVRVQAIYRGERARNRVVQPALDAFRDVCERISAEGPSGLTTACICGPVKLPRWFSDGHSDSSRCSGVCGCDFHGAAASCDCTADAAATPTPAPSAAIAVADAATMPTPVIEEHQMQPSPPATQSRLGPGAAAAILACTGSRRDPIETTEQESGKEEEIVQSNATAAGEPSQPGHDGSSGLGLPQIAEKSTEERDLIGGGDGAVAEKSAGRDKLRHQEQSVASSNDNEKALGCRLAPPPSSESGATTQGGGSGGASVGLLAGSTLKQGEVDSQQPLMARSTPAAETDCFTYSDGESDSCASPTPATNTIENSDVLMPNDDAPASPEVVVQVTAVAPRYGAEGGVVQTPSYKQQESRRPSHVVGEIIASVAGTSSIKHGKDNFDGEAVVGDDVATGYEGDECDNDTPAADDMGNKNALPGHSWDTASAIVPEFPGGGKDSREGEVFLGGRRSRRESERRRKSDLLVDAWTTSSSPTRHDSQPCGREQSGGDRLWSSLALSTASSFEASPLKGETIPALAHSARSDCSTAHRLGDGDGAGDDFLLADSAEVPAISKPTSSISGGVGDDVPKPFLSWLDEGPRYSRPDDDPGAAEGHDRRPLFSPDIDRRATGRTDVQESHHPRAPRTFAGDGVGVLNGQHHEDRTHEVNGAVRIEDWSSRELEEELRRIRGAVESRVRYLRSVMQQPGSGAT
ncbi:unnamed protein product [Ectocarpus sp. CCAP 1310/34]|nr:unnamed protein product [Ectocarpus sp. CCAP 1310/34]